MTNSARECFLGSGFVGYVYHNSLDQTWQYAIKDRDRNIVVQAYNFSKISRAITDMREQAFHLGAS